MNNSPIPNPDSEMAFPIHTSVIFSMDVPSSDSGLQYGRIANRTRQHLEELLCTLHHASDGCVTASGSAAILTACMLLKRGSRVLHHEEVYEGTRRILSLMDQFGIESIETNLLDPKKAQQAIWQSKPKLVWIETPTNPSLRVLDIRALAELAHRQNALVAVDTTMCSSVLQTPLEHGADIVVESLTKLLNGHSDAMGGFIGARDANLASRIRSIIQTVGPTLSPFDASLIERGIKTAEIRARAQQQTAIAVAKFLSHHNHVARVLFPGSWSMEERRVMKSQMRGRGSIISFELAASIDPVRMVQALRTIKICHSFGGTETIVQLPAVMMDFSGVSSTSIPSRRMIRLSVGLEPHQTIINDLEQALEQSTCL